MEQEKKQAGFEYYLGRLEEEKAKERTKVSRTVLKLLAQDPEGEETLSNLVSQYFSYKPSENELVEFTTILRTMVDEELVKMQMPEGAHQGGYQKLAFSITETGRKLLDVSNDIQMNM